MARTGKPKHKFTNQHLPRRVYSDQEVANALNCYRINGSNASAVTKTAAQLGIPKSTIMRWIKGKNKSHVGPLAERNRGDWVDTMNDVMWQLIESVPGKIKGAPLNQVMTGFGILFDKKQLMTGQATTININRDEVDFDVRKLSDEQLFTLLTICNQAATTPSHPVESQGGTRPTEAEPLRTIGVADHSAGP